MSEPLPTSAFRRPASPLLWAFVAVPVAVYFALLPAVAGSFFGALATAAGATALGVLVARSRARRRDRRAARPIADIVAALASEPSVLAMVRGRVRTLVRARGEPPGCALAARSGQVSAGRFLVEDESGCALIDDDELVVVTHREGALVADTTICDGDEVLAFGRARLDAAPQGYRATSRTLVLEGSRERPLEIVRL